MNVKEHGIHLQENTLNQKKNDQNVIVFFFFGSFFMDAIIVHQTKNWESIHQTKPLTSI